ncbi:MAG: protein phosphatase 2C domain-containing protein [Pseudomonadota bacterium]
MQFQCAAQTHIGLRRKLNEDSLLDRSDIGLWAVADGMGGHQSGDVASAAVVSGLGELQAGTSSSELARSAITALDAVNEELIAFARAEVQPSTVGSTVVGLAVLQGTFACFWAGDSRAYRVRGRSIEQITSDHSLVNDLIKAGMISADEAESHPSANVITRAIGVSREVEVDCVTGDVAPGDIFVLASDGITRVMAADEIMHAVLTRNPTQAAEAMVAVVLDRGAPDNLTVVIVRIM